MSDLIDQMKNNWKPFIKLTHDEKTSIVTAGEENCVCWHQEMMCWADCGTYPFKDEIVYRIKEDYQPEPEKCEVFEEYGRLYFIYNGNHYSLTEALNLAAFSHYECDQGRRMSIRNSLSGDTSYPKYVVFRKESK